MKSSDQHPRTCGPGPVQVAEQFGVVEQVLPGIRGKACCKRLITLPTSAGQGFRVWTAVFRQSFGIRVIGFSAWRIILILVALMYCSPPRPLSQSLGSDRYEIADRSPPSDTGSRGLLCNGSLWR
jgi:hypothetical protein